MTAIASFVFNPFQENTFILYDETKECIIVDPGCYNASEQQQLTRFIDSNQLTPVQLINTHCHVDHIFGNQFVAQQYGLKLAINELELPVLRGAVNYGAVFGVKVDPSPEPEIYLNEGDKVEFGSSQLEILFTPGHSPGEISLFCRSENFVLAGDVLFLQSIGRTDLPGGDYETLISSIKKKLLPLGDNTKVYSGHGPETSIGFERINNPFLQNSDSG